MLVIAPALRLAYVAAIGLILTNSLPLAETAYSQWRRGGEPLTRSEKVAFVTSGIVAVGFGCVGSYIIRTC